MMTFPALYECTLCSGHFVWHEIDGEAGPFCPACDRKVHTPKRPRKIRDLTMAESRQMGIALRFDDV